MFAPGVWKNSERKLIELVQIFEENSRMWSEGGRGGDPGHPAGDGSARLLDVRVATPQQRRVP